MKNSNILSAEQQQSLITTLKVRFEKNRDRHKTISWNDVLSNLEQNPDKLWSLNEMERTGGEPDVIRFDDVTNQFVFCDCSAESPSGRRSLCYDRQALDARKENKPVGCASDMANEIGIELLSEESYRTLQTLGKFDSKTSSWIKTPDEIRKLGGALFADFRYGKVFVYHNSAPSYYASRGFRGELKV